MKTVRMIGCVVMVVVAVSASVQAVNWTGGGSTTAWNLGANWSSGLEPTAGDLARIGNGSVLTPMVDIGSAAVAQRCFIGDATGADATLSIKSGGSLQTNYYSDGVRVGVVDGGGTGTGTVNVEAGGTLNGDAGFLGYTATCTGIMNVEGTANFGVAGTGGNPLTVGRYGAGELYITGAVNVYGPGGGILELADYSGSTGLVEVSDSGSLYVRRYMRVGNNGGDDDAGILRVVGSNASVSMNEGMRLSADFVYEVFLDADLDVTMGSLQMSGNTMTIKPMALPGLADNEITIMTYGSHDAGSGSLMGLLNLVDDDPTGTWGIFEAESGSIVLSYEANEIPEPTTLLLVGTGALGALGYIRRRKLN